MTDAELLSAAIEAAGYDSVRKFAHDVLIRDHRMVYRWLAGKWPLPAPVKDKCRELIKAQGQHATKP